MADATTTTLAPVLMPTIPVRDPNEVRRERWWEIRNRIASSGEVTQPAEIDQLADDIEAFENSGKDATENGQIRSIVQPMMSGGYVKMRNIIEEATRAWNRPFAFDVTTPAPTK